MGIKWMIKKSDYAEIRKSVSKDADNKKLEALKKEVIAILEKKDSQEVKKAIEYFEKDELRYSHLEKSVSGEWIEKAGYGVGTVRIWKGKKYKKVSASPVRWVRVFDKNDRGAASSMGKYIAQVKKCNSVEELYQFCMKQRSLFQDENGVDLPIMDKLRAAIDEQKGKVGDELDGSKHFQYKDKESKMSTNETFPKVMLNRSYIAIMARSASENIDETIEKIKKQITDNPDSKEMRSRLAVAEKIKALGDNKNAYETIEDAIENNSFDKLDIEESENKTYWIQDFKGNRITSDDAKDKIKENFNKIDALKESFKSKDKAGQIKAAADMTYLQDENQHLLDRLNADDRSEMKAESTLHNNPDAKVPSEESEKNRQERIDQNKKDKENIDNEIVNAKKWDIPVDAYKAAKDIMSDNEVAGRLDKQIKKLIENGHEIFGEFSTNDLHNMQQDIFTDIGSKYGVSGKAIAYVYDNLKPYKIINKDIVDQDTGKLLKEYVKKYLTKPAKPTKADEFKLINIKELEKGKPDNMDMADFVQQIIESEFEKHQNRSDAMKGNKNAYKGKAEMEKMPLDDLEKYKDDLYEEYIHIDIKKKDKLGDARERYREALDIWKERIKKERDVQSEFQTQLMNKLHDGIESQKKACEEWNLKEMSDWNLNRYITEAEKWKDKGLVYLADPIIDKFKNSKKEMFEGNDFVGNAMDYQAFAVAHSGTLEKMKKELEFRKNASPEKKEEIKEQTKDDKPVKNQNISLNPYEPTENTNPDKLKPISINTSTGDNQVTLPYSKDLVNEIKSLVNVTNKDKYSSRKFLDKVYYEDGNLISTDGRRLKVVKVGTLDGIESGCYVDIDSNKDGIKITKDEDFTKENKFPQYKRVIPESLDQKITLDNKALKNKIKTLKEEGGWSNKDPVISFEIQDGNLMLDGEKVGDAKGVQFEGNAVTSDFFNMNAEYVLNALSGDTSNLMCSSDSEKAMTIGTNSTVNVIMPMSKTTIHYGQNGKQEEYVNRKDYKSQKASKSAEREQKNKLKTARQDSLNEYIGELKKQWNDEKINKLINSVNDTNMKDHAGVIKHSYEALKEAEKMINNPTSSFDDSKTSNRYGYNLYAICQMNPKFKTDLENMAKQYGIEVRKSLFDYIDFELDDFENESYSDYDASQPDLFNSTSYKVGAALDSIFGC